MTADHIDEERLEASQWFWYSDLLERSGLTDVQRGSGETGVSDGILSFSVGTTSRGRVALGTIRIDKIRKVAASLDAGQLAAYREHVRDAKALALELVLPYAQELETRRRAPLEGKARAKEAKIARAVGLHREHKSPARIAQIMCAEGLIAGDKDPARTVRRWLKEAKSRTDREVSDFR